MKTTVFCPNCGTANRDDAAVCSECGSMIPKIAEDTPPKKTSALSAADFGIIEDVPPAKVSPSYPPPPPPGQTSRPTTGQSAYEPRGFVQAGSKIVCDRCGTVLQNDDKQCPGCGNPIQSSAYRPATPYPITPPPPQNAPAQPYQPATPYPPPRQPTPPPQKIDGKKSKISKCAKCGAIVYDYETRCNNCGRILAPPKPAGKAKQAASMPGQAPPGTARCGRCNAIVYPHQTVCPNCGKHLDPIAAPPAQGSGQRVSRCRRCGHTVYPTDTVCPNCGRSLDAL